MPGRLLSVLTARDIELRDRPLDAVVGGASLEELLAECGELDAFRREAENLYERVRALFFLYALHRFHLPKRLEGGRLGRIPFEGQQLLLRRQFEEAIEAFLAEQRDRGPSDATSSALAAGYRALGFETLAAQVRHSVRSVRGNPWMFAVRHPADSPLRARPEMTRAQADGRFPVLREATPVRMDLTHSGWSDIFFLGMDHPEGAKVLNISIDLGVRGRDERPRPPIESSVRVIDEPLLRLVSVDLETTAEVRDTREVFDFAKDYLGLLKAALIAAGVVPPSLEHADVPIEDVLRPILGPGRGLEVVSHVRGIPKGSRLAVSTNLLASLIAVCMRATGQTRALVGPLREEERRLVAARAILGEWLGGSGGGWQDSGGLWPSVKLIEGALAREGDPEFGTSRGRLLPDHKLLHGERVPPASLRALCDSLVLVHGGMAQDVGPILEMVTERYLLRSEPEWSARGEALGVLDEVLLALEAGDARAVGAATHRNFTGPIQTIIPWAGNLYSEALIDRVRARFGDAFWGFWMLGGMSGGGMGFLFDPSVKPRAQEELQRVLAETRAELHHAVPFAIQPIVYDFEIDERGSSAEWAADEGLALPTAYYALRVPELLRRDPAALSPNARADLAAFARAGRGADGGRLKEELFDALFPEEGAGAADDADLDALLARNGFDREQHEKIRADLRSGRIGLARNRLPADTVIEDVEPGDVFDARRDGTARFEKTGRAAIDAGSVGIVLLAAGAGSRWTKGAGVVKALHPFARLAGRHRSFLDVHLAKRRSLERRTGVEVPLVVTTSYLSHDPVEAALATARAAGEAGGVHLSRGRSVGLRLVPMQRDLRFAWEESAQQLLEEQAQKMRMSLQAALITWAHGAGEGNDYRDNLPAQCLHPVGHWYEVPNLLLNGTLARLLRERPELRTLLLHNVDTLGVDLDAGLLGWHLEHENALSFEVVPRRIEDRGGGLARVNGRVRLVESLALPREEDEFRLSFYNSMTTWIDVDRTLAAFGLTRYDLDDEARVADSIRGLARRMPTYVTLKDVKRRWGHGHEDVYPTAQFEKLWGDMTILRELPVGFLVVPRLRGQQLKEPAQLDGWLRDGSAAHVVAACDFEGSDPGISGP